MKRLLYSLIVLSLCLCCLTGCKEKEDFSHIYDYDASNSPEEILKAVKEKEYVVFEESICTSGETLWESFYQSVLNKKSASLKIAHYYTLDETHYSEEYIEEYKDDYPMIFLGNIYYDGHQFHYVYKVSTQENLDADKHYQYLMKYTGEPTSPHSIISHYEYYVLINEPIETWDEIERRICSSSWDDYIDFSIIYEIVSYK